jgi:hypothetical protein
MFDLDEAVRAWGEKMRDARTCQTEDVLEMESHLRETVADLSAGNLSEEEAFLVAARRLGSVGELAEEFGKVNPTLVWRHRLFWMAAGCLALLFIRGIHYSAITLGFAAAAASGFPSWAVWAVPVCATALFISGCVVTARRMLQRGTDAADRRLRRMTERRVGRTFFVTAIALLTIGELALQLGSQLAMARVLAVSEIGKIAVRNAVIGWTSPVLMAVFLALLMVWARPSRRSIQTQQ